MARQLYDQLATSQVFYSVQFSLLSILASWFGNLRTWFFPSSFFLSMWNFTCSDRPEQEPHGRKREIFNMLRLRIPVIPLGSFCSICPLSKIFWLTSVIIFQSSTFEFPWREFGLVPFCSLIPVVVKFRVCSTKESHRDPGANGFCAWFPDCSSSGCNCGRTCNGFLVSDVNWVVFASEGGVVKSGVVSVVVELDLRGSDDFCWVSDRFFFHQLI
uniref:Uncharacterized protein n=1 Tax=Daphnia galeata TaxID=27404 RepID=A0A8J2S1P6_9CRUS|nr:unnamed protein product [Daphnia galeata]